MTDRPRALCADCFTEMIDDDGAGDLCPKCDQHSIAECGEGFPCSGFDGRPCVLNRPPTDLSTPDLVEEWLQS